MPIYEYQCTNCGHQLEAMQKFSEAPLTECPECHQAALSKLVSAAGFQLKGSGWYVTDYSKKGKAKAKEDEANAPTSDTKPAETKPTESKPTETKSSDSSNNSGAESA